MSFGSSYQLQDLRRGGEDVQASSEKIYAILTAVKLLTMAGGELNHEFRCAALDRGMDLARCAKDTVGLMEALAAMTMLAELLEA